MLLEKVSIHTEILFVHCYKFFLLLLVLLLVFVENCILLPKGINDLLCSCVLYMYGFDFLPFYPDFYYWS
jgi:hypothetical protein